MTHYRKVISYKRSNKDENIKSMKLKFNLFILWITKYFRKNSNSDCRISGVKQLGQFASIVNAIAFFICSKIAQNINSR